MPSHFLQFHVPLACGLPAQDICQSRRGSKNCEAFDVGAALCFYSLVVRTVRPGDIYPYDFRIDTEHLGRDLPVHGVGANADVAHGSSQPEGAVRFYEDLGLGFSYADVTIGERDSPATDEPFTVIRCFPFASAPLGKAANTLQHVERVRIAHGFSVRFRIALSESVPQPKFQRIQIERPRHLVHVTLYGEKSLHLAGRAKITGRHLVGIDDQACHADVRHAVAAGGHECPVHTVLGRARAVGSAVVVHVGVPSPEPAVSLYPGAQLNSRRVARLAILQLFLVALDKFYRLSRGTRQVVRHDAVFRTLLAAERTTGGRRVNHDHFFRHVGVLGEPAAYRERRLVTLPNADSPLAIDLNHSRSRFDEALVDHLSAESILKNLIRFRESLLHVSLGRLH